MPDCCNECQEPWVSTKCDIGLSVTDVDRHHHTMVPPSSSIPFQITAMSAAWSHGFQPTGVRVGLGLIDSWCSMTIVQRLRRLQLVFKFALESPRKVKYRRLHGRRLLAQRSLAAN